MRYLFTIASLCTLIFAGCGGNPEPLCSHGKPIAFWVAELQKPDARARKKAVVALGNAGGADAAAIPALVGAVKDAHAGVRSQAVLALLRLGPAAKDAIPALTEARNDKDASVRSYALMALERIQR